MKYEKPVVEVVRFDNHEVFMTGSISHAEVLSSGLKECYSVTWAGRTSNQGNYPLIDCRDVVFGNGVRKNDQVYSVPCITYHH